MTAPFGGPDRDIWRLLLAGASFDRVCAIGRHRRTWLPSDVHRIATALFADGKPKPVSGPQVVDGHGTPARAKQHYREGEKPCEPCRRAHNAAKARRDARKAAEVVAEGETRAG